MTGLLAQTEPTLMLNLLVILAAAGVVAVLMHRLRMATVPAYLLTGMLIGPHTFGVVSESEHVEAIGGLAIILLMFGIGLHLDSSALKGRLATYVLTGFGAVVVCVLLLWPCAMLLGIGASASLVCAMALSLSSTAVVVRLLQQRRELSGSKGRLSLAVLIVQDLLVCGMLLALPIIAHFARGGSGAADFDLDKLGSGALVLHALVRLTGLAGLVVFGKFVLPRLLAEAAKMRSGEVLVVIATAFAIGAAVSTSAMGLSPELGAFLGGFLLSGTSFKHHISGQIGTLRDLFIAVFFTAFGMHIRPGVIADHLVIVAVGSVGVVTLKVLGIGLACWCCGASVRVSIVIGMILAQAGEFALVILSKAGPGSLGIIDESIETLITAIIAVTLVLTPLLISLTGTVADKVSWSATAPWLRSHASDGRDDRAYTEVGSDERRHIVIAGFGVVGRAVADRIGRTEATVTIVELNPGTVRQQNLLGRSIVYGDISSADVLESAGIHRAEALILTIPDEESVLRACSVARSLNPDIFIIARTNFLSRGMLMRGVGANTIVVEEMATAKAMDEEIHRYIERWNAGGTRPPAADLSE